MMFDMDYISGNLMTIMGIFVLKEPLTFLFTGERKFHGRFDIRGTGRLEIST